MTPAEHTRSAQSASADRTLLHFQELEAYTDQPPLEDDDEEDEGGHSVKCGSCGRILN